jgi:hypothetical protein
MFVGEKEEREITYAYVAMRVYALDLCLRYFEMKNQEANLALSNRKYRPILAHIPRCYIAAACTRCFGHPASCHIITIAVNCLCMRMHVFCIVDFS